MILFWLICGLLIAIALAFVLPPLLAGEKNTPEVDVDRKEANILIYRDQLQELDSDLVNGIVSQQQFEQDREDIERRLLEDTSSMVAAQGSKKGNNRTTAYAVALAIPLIAVIFYLKVGSTQGISGAPANRISEPSSMADGNRSAQQIGANVDKLAEKLKANPNDLQGWTMLARSYSSMERFGEATGAYAKATELNPNDADLWAEYAFATAMAGNRKLDAQAMEFVNRALKVDPENAKALQLAGTAAFDAKDYKKAIEIWQRVLSKAPADSEVAQAITERINEAKKLSGQK